MDYHLGFLLLFCYTDGNNTVQHPDWLERKSSKLQLLWVKSVKQNERLILHVFLAKSFCIFYHSLRTSCRVIFKSKYWCVLQDCQLKAILSRKWLECCIAKILQQNFVTPPRYWSATSAREDKQLIQMVIDNRFIPAARLCVEMIRRFLRRL